jgi:predicted Fe-Mo cluster-binding NifX family protein
MAETVVSEARKARTKKTDEELKSEALNLFYEIQRHGLKPFEGASVDFHQKRELVVFIPGESPVMVAVKHEELLEFLLKNGVRRVLVDALFPARAETLSAMSKAGIEVYFIRRTTIVETFRKYLRKKLKIEVPRKNDFTDAVLQSFIKPKYIQQTDWRYLDCWLEMHLWRDNSGDYQKYRQKLKTYPLAKRDKIAKLIADIEKTAQEFVDTVLKHYPEVKEHFKKLRITDDIITQAYYCEVYLEMIVCKSFAGVLKKAGIDVSQKAHLKKLEQRRQKEEQKDGEEQSKDEKEKEKTFIYDGKFANALNQLTIKVRRLNPYKKKHKQRIPVATILLAKEIWLMLEEERRQNEGGRVGEALGWMSRASRKGGIGADHPRLQDGGLSK